MIFKLEILNQNFKFSYKIKNNFIYKISAIIVFFEFLQRIRDQIFYH